MGLLRGRVRPEAGMRAVSRGIGISAAVRGVVGRGKLDGDGVAGEKAAGPRVGGKKIRDREARQPQQVPRSARAVVLADDLDSHGVV